MNIPAHAAAGGLYSFKSRYAGRLAPVRRVLVAAGVRPGAITGAGIVCGALAGAALALLRPGLPAGVAVTALLAARLARANLDGGVARDGDRATPFGRCSTGSAGGSGGGGRRALVTVRIGAPVVIAAPERPGRVAPLLTEGRTMIMDSFGRYLSQTVHDHEPGPGDEVGGATAEARARVVALAAGDADLSLARGTRPGRSAWESVRAAWCVAVCG